MPITALEGTGTVAQFARHVALVGKLLHEPRLHVRVSDPVEETVYVELQASAQDPPEDTPLEQVLII